MPETYQGFCPNCMFNTTRPVCERQDCEPNCKHGHCAACGYPLEEPREVPF